MQRENTSPRAPLQTARGGRRAPAGILRSWPRRAATALVLATSLVGAGLAGAGTAQAAGSAQVSIDATTSALYVYDQDIDQGTGSYAGVDVTGVVTCPESLDMRDMTLVQDGYAAYWATSGLGAGDWYCSGEAQPISMSFYDPTHALHAGPATASITITDGDTGETMGTATRTVTIPASAPSVPTAAVGSSTGATTASLTWSTPVVAGTITGYRVSRDGGAPGAAGWSTTVSASTHSLTFAKLRTGRTYTLSVSAIDSAGTGAAATAAVTAGAPGQPATVRGTVVSASSVKVTWSPPATTGGAAVTGYRVSRDAGSSGSGSPWSTTVSGSTRTLTFAKLASGTRYTFSVSAVNSRGTGAARTTTLDVVPAS